MRRAAVALALLLAVWLAAGVRKVDEDRFGVVDGPLPGPGRLVRSGWTIAPPLLFRLATYPAVGVELPLPDAQAARLAAADGSRYGLRGWITLRPRVEDWRALHEAAAGGGLEAVLLAAVREAAAELPQAGPRAQVTATLERDLERRLTAALAERGVDLRRWELSSFDRLTAAAGEAGEVPHTRLLVVGLDGGDWAIVDELLAAGKLPNLARLIDDGVRAKLLSISPMLSPVIWTSIATGVEPSRHGILDFLVEEPGGGSRQPVTSAQRRVPTVWEMLSRVGIDVGVVGWWASWPADPVRGYLVSDRIAYQLFNFEPDLERAEGKTWPPDLYAEIRDRIVEPESIPWERVLPYLDGARRTPERFTDDEREMLDQFRTLLASGETYLSLAGELSQRFRPHLEVVYFEGTDTAAHLFMPYRAPRLPGVDGARFESFRDVVDRYYETADRYLGELLEGRGEEWTVMILSDHGFASDATRPRSSDSRIGHGAAADWHRRFGMLVLSGNHVRRGGQLDETSIYDVAPTILALFGQPIPRSWPGHALGPALDEEFLARYPIRYRNDDPERQDAVAADLLDPAAADLVKKLQSLGYVSSGGGGAGDSVTARNNAGVALLAEGRYAEAEAEFRAGLEGGDGDTPMLLVNLGLVLRLQQRPDEARPYLERAAERPATLRMAGHQLAQMELDAGDLDTAEGWLRRILDAEPGAAEVLNTLGALLERRDDLASAEASYRRAAELDPDAAMPRNNLGNLFKRRARLDEAERWYLDAIEADPYFMGAYNNLALVYQAQGKLDRAIDLYGRALAKAPTNAIVLNNLATLYHARGEIDEARELWEQAAAADPEYESPPNNLASLAINAGRFDEAERLLRRALELDPNYGDARINLAIVLRRRGDVAGARDQLRRATEDERAGMKSWIQLGMFELEQGDAAAALRALEPIAGLYPPHVEWLNPLGEAYLRAGRPEEALATWRRSLELRPDQPRLREIVETRPWEARGS